MEGVPSSTQLIAEGVPSSTQPIAADPEPAPEPAPAGEASTSPADAAAAEEFKKYVAYGLTVGGLRHVAKEFGIGADVTTSDLCQLHIKGRTLPPHYTSEPRLVDATNRYYNHTYYHTPDEGSAPVQCEGPPTDTCSMAEVMLRNPSTARFVGKPTHFLSHAWLYRFLNLVAALEAYVAVLPPGEPEPFFWFDCLVLDQHANNGEGSDWWSETFLRAIGAIGHTVMMLSPWDNPIPLTRAWCLWELYCTHQADVEFSVCLGPDERAAFERAIVKDPSVVLDAFSQIDVAAARAGNARDEAMIKQAVCAQVGFEQLNAIAFARMREWILGVARELFTGLRVGTAEGKEEDEGKEFWRMKWAVPKLFRLFGELAEAKALYQEVLAGKIAHFGARHIETLQSKMSYANLLADEGTVESVAEAKALYREVVVGHTELSGTQHVSTLTAKMNLALLLDEECERAQGPSACLVEGGTEELVTEAKVLYREVVAGETEHYGARHVETLTSKMNLANLLCQREGTAESVVEAKALYQEALPVFSDHYGARHVDTLNVNLGLAMVLQKEGHVDQAIDEMRRVAAGFEQHFQNPDHPWVVDVRSKLSAALAERAASAVGEHSDVATDCLDSS